MYEETLTDIGLTKNESIVYITLLRLGNATAGTIIKESGISSGKIYETFDKLIKKGLVYYSERNGVKYFSATETESLLSYIDELEQSIHQKREKISKILPELIKLQKKEDVEYVNLVEGFRGIRSLLEKVFASSSQEPVFAMGVSSGKDTKFNNFWINMFQTHVEGKRQAKMIFVDKGSEYYKKYQKLKSVEIRTTTMISPSAMDIIDDNVLIFSYDQVMKCIHIKSKPIATSFKSFFESIWNIADT